MTYNSISDFVLIAWASMKVLLGLPRLAVLGVGWLSLQRADEVGVGVERCAILHAPPF